MKFKYFVFVPILLLLTSFTFSSVILKQDEIYEIENKELVVYSIGEESIKVNVDGVKNVISVGEQKEVNGVKITVNSIFYDDLPEERTVEMVLSMAFYCGDGNCDADQNETKVNCCEDCGCSPGYVCSDGVCKTEAQIKKEQEEEEEKSADKCEKDADCDDNDTDTEDTCLSKPGQPNRCLNIPLICKTDIECDDQDPCTIDKCEDSDCFNTKVPNFVECWQKQEIQDVEEKEEGKEEEPVNTSSQEIISEEPKTTASSVSSNLIWILTAVLVIGIGMLILFLKRKGQQRLPEEGFIKKN